MRKLAVTIAVFLSAFCLHTADAAENWTPRLGGLYEGLANAALPPKGYYFVNTTMTSHATGFDQSGRATNVRTSVFVDVPAVLWVPGVKLLGADYAAAVAQPFNYLGTKYKGTSSPYEMDAWGQYNTFVIPGELSWALPNDFHVLAGMGIYLPTGRFEKPPYAGGSYGGFANSIGFWALEPTLGITWLSDGWNVSAHMSYNYNFENPDTHFTTGQIVQGDYTVTKTIDAWTVGIGGYSIHQITDDRSKYPAVQSLIDGAKGNRVTVYAAGPIVGYNFGPFSVTAQFNQGFGAKNTCSGGTYWTRLIIPFVSDKP